MTDAIAAGLRKMLQTLSNERWWAQARGGVGLMGLPTGRPGWRRAFALLGALLLGVSGCNEAVTSSEKKAPPRAPLQRVCRTAHEDPGLGVPIHAGTFCLDVRVDVQRYGAGFPLGLDWGCTEVLAGECDIYKDKELRSIKTFRYASASGSAEISGVLSEFSHARGAFSLFALRRAFAQRGVAPRAGLFQEKKATSGAARVFRNRQLAAIWGGRRVLELRRMDSVHEANSAGADGPSDVAWAELTDTILQQFGRGEGGIYELDILEDSSGSASIDLFQDDLLGIRGSGHGAIAREGVSHQQLISVRRDESAAKDFLTLLSREFGGQLLKEKSVVRARRRRPGFAPETWFFSRSGRVVVGVGPGDEVESRGDHEADLWQGTALAEIAQLQKLVHGRPPPDFD